VEDCAGGSGTGQPAPLAATAARQPIPTREHLEAAVENDDVAEARRLLAGFEFSDEQRRNVEQLLDAWERQQA
jgi:hypothetical protein